jgi:hypothetical protein
MFKYNMKQEFMMRKQLLSNQIREQIKIWERTWPDTEKKAHIQNI